MKTKRIQCDNCSHFIPLTPKDKNNLMSAIKSNAKCNLGNRVMFRKPKDNSYLSSDSGGYFRCCNDYKQEERTLVKKK